MTEEKSTGARNRPFKQAAPSGLLIDAARELVRLQLSLGNKLQVSTHDLKKLKSLPKGAGVILISNHADEMDPRICLELSRRVNRRFISMCNREAFDELSGLAGWALQHLGHFSVERGAHDSRAKNYAIDVVADGKDVLLIFPEGEIFYLNDEVQPFHSGALEIGMQAVLKKRQSKPDWNAYIVPMAIRYQHRGRIEPVLDARISRMERALELPKLKASFTERLRRIQKTVLARKESAHEVQVSVEEDLFEQIISTEHAILARVEERHREVRISQNRIIDESWQLGAEIRAEISSTHDALSEIELKKELVDLQEVAHLESWRPHYYEGDITGDHMAEAVLKLEREIFQIKRPRQLTRRNVFVGIGEPIPLGSLVERYKSDPHAFRHELTSNLHDTVQSLVDNLAKKCSTGIAR